MINFLTEKLFPNQIFQENKNINNGQHIAVVATITGCTIHRWASDVEMKDDVIGCTDCEVYLCVNCYQLFHMVPNLVDKKDELRDLYNVQRQTKLIKPPQTTKIPLKIIYTSMK